MKKLTLIIAFALIFALCLPVTALADGQGACDVIDWAGVMTEDELATLTEAGQNALYSLDYDSYLVIVTVNRDEMDGMEATPFADWVFDNYYNQSCPNGTVLLMVMPDDAIAPRGELAVSTAGEHIGIIDDSDVDEIMDAGAGEMINGNVFACASGMITRFSVETDDSYHGIMWVISAVIGAAIGLVVGLIVKASIKGSYAKNGQSGEYDAGENVTYNETKRQDIYLTTDISRVKVAAPPPNQSGGTTTHTSSSGVSHGGSSRKL